MSVNGDVSEQVVRLSLEGFEVLARLTGSGAKNVAAMIYTIMKDKKQTKGKINLNNMIRTGKPLKIFTVSKEDLKKKFLEKKKQQLLLRSSKAVKQQFIEDNNIGELDKNVNSKNLNSKTISKIKEIGDLMNQMKKLDENK